MEMVELSDLKKYPLDDHRCGVVLFPMYQIMGYSPRAVVVMISTRSPHEVATGVSWLLMNSDAMNGFIGLFG